MKIKSIVLFFLLASNSCIGFSQSNTQLILSPSLVHFDYTEFNTFNEVLDQELGWLSGIEVGLNHAITASWSININSSYHQGTVDYDGKTQQGEPHTTDTKTKLFRYSARIEKSIYQKMFLFASVQSHNWKRNIQDNNNISGLSENYKWIEYAIGANADIFTLPKDIFNVEVAYLITRNGTINVDLSRVNLGSTTLDLGDGTGGRLIFNWKRRSENNTRYGMSLFFEAWDFGRSNTKQTQGSPSIVFVTEPRSETQNIGLKVNIEYSF